MVERSRRVTWASRALAVAALVLVGLGLATFVLFFRPQVDQPTHADAVVVFGGRSREERLPAGLKLMRAGVADVLVVSVPPEGFDCGRREPFRVLCFTPRPFTTRGEARTVSDLADRNGWESIVLVTSTYHVTRASLLLRRCFDGRVDAVAAEPPTRRETLDELLHEWGGLVDAVVRGC